MLNHTHSSQRLVFIGALALTFATGLVKAQGDLSPQASSAGSVSNSNGVTVLNVQNQPASVDFVHAKPKPLPTNSFASDPASAMIQALANPQDLGPTAYSPGFVGSGKTSPVFLGVPEIAEIASTSQTAGFTSEDFGTANHPFSTARADLFTLNTNTTYPYRAAGKLFFNQPAGSFICSASLIRRGIVVTAAHCVANYGQKQFYSGWQFVPGYRYGAAPFGVWTVRQVVVPTAYYNGTDNCSQYGVVCPDDVAVLILNTQNGGYAGTSVGWFGYWYGGGFTSGGLVQITQLGYPAGLDNAFYMERNDSYGYVSASNSNNTVIGSDMDGGSSGGPWLVNFGLPYALTGETDGSGYTFTNAVVGVTSWGSKSTAPKEQGASPFTNGNIQTILTSACGAVPAACS